jgi:hypothetical protein
MKLHLLCSTAAAALVLLAQPCTASTVIDTYPDWDGNIVNGWQKVAQTFVVPAGDTVLDNYTFGIALQTTTPTFMMEIFEWDVEDGPVGCALYSRQLTWPTLIGDVVIEDIDLHLTEGTRYAVIFDFGNGYNGPSIHWQENQNSYPDGNMTLWNPPLWHHLNSEWNTKFRAEFVSPCSPDVNCDGVVDIQDLLEVLAAWGTSP